MRTYRRDDEMPDEVRQGFESRPWARVAVLTDNLVTYVGADPPKSEAVERELEP